MSEFHVRVVQIDTIVPHDNADKLEIVMVDGGYPVCVKKGDYRVSDKAIYLPIDSIVPEEEEYFRFLCPPESILADSTIPEKYRRIKAKKLRGVFSMGMLCPMDLLPFGPEEYEPGEDVQETLGVEKWDPDAGTEAGAPVDSNQDGMTAKRRAYAALPFWKKPLSKIFWGRLKWRLIVAVGLRPPAFSQNIEGPSGFPEYTDIDSLRKHSKWFQDGEQVVITEKIHGANFRAGWVDGKFWVGSHHQFKRRPTGVQMADIFWKAAMEAGLEEKLRAVPDIAFFGEVYGAVQAGFGYDAPGKLSIRFFDALNTKTRRYLDSDKFFDLCEALKLPTVPKLFCGAWQQFDVRRLADGRSLIGQHIREGFVVRPREERQLPHGKRVILKLVGEEYLLKAAR